MENWQERHEKVSKVGAELKKLKTPEEIYNYLRSVGLDFVRQVKDPAAREYMIQRVPSAIGMLPRASCREQTIALTKNFSNIFYIKHPDPAVVSKFLKNTPDLSVDFSKLAEKLKDATGDLQLLIVKRAPCTIGIFTSPTPAAIQLALDNTPAPLAELLTLAKKHGINVSKYASANTEHQAAPLK